MSILLFRVDERLIHGQVMVAWARRLGPRRVIVVDEALAAAPAEQEIYRAGLAEGIEAAFWSVAEAVRRLPSVAASAEPAFVLTENLDTVLRLAREGVEIRDVNVGGIHAGPGRDRVLPYVCLDAADGRRIRELEESGVRVVAQDVPTADPVRLVERSPS